MTDVSRIANGPLGLRFSLNVLPRAILSRVLVTEFIFHSFFARCSSHAVRPSVICLQEACRIGSISSNRSRSPRKTCRLWRKSRHVDYSLHPIQLPEALPMMPEDADNVCFFDSCDQVFRDWAQVS